MIRRVLAVATVFTVIMEAIAFALKMPEQTLISIPAGAVAAMGSFLVLAVVLVRAGFQATEERPLSRWPVAVVAILGCLKLVLIGIVLWWLISRALIEPLAFLAGFSTMVVALLHEGMKRP